MPDIKLSAGDLSFNLKIGEQEPNQGAHLSIYAGGDDHTHGNSTFEADPGFIILEATPAVESEWGEHGYEVHQTARDANFEKIEKLAESFEKLVASSQEKSKNLEKDDVSKSLHEVRKYLFDYYYKFTSSNAHFEVNAFAKSHTIRGPFNVVLDTKTANLVMHFNFRTYKLITKEEFEPIRNLMEQAIIQNIPVKMEIMIPDIAKTSIADYEKRKLAVESGVTK